MMIMQINAKRSSLRIAVGGLLLIILFVLIVFLIGLWKKINVPQMITDSPTAKSIELQWYVDDYNLENTWGNDVASKIFNEKLGVAVQFVTSRTINDEYLSVMLASKSAPDLVTLRHNSPQISKMINEGKAADLEALVSLLSPDSHYLKYLEYNRYNGHLYLCPGIVGKEFDSLYHLYDVPALIVREDIYRQLGSPDMTTPEGFLETLSRVDQPDVMPLGLDELTETGCDSIDTVLMQFLAVPYFRNNEAYDRYRDPSLQQWILCFSHAYRQGYLTQNALIDSEEQIRLKLAQGRYFAFIANVAKYEQELQQSPLTYIAVEPPRNLNGDAPTLMIETENVGKQATLVNAASPHIESALKLLAYFADDEGQSDAYLGRLDVTYSINSIGIDLVNHSIIMRDTSRKNYQTIYGGLFTYSMLVNFDAVIDYPGYHSTVLHQPYEWRSKYSISASQLGMNKMKLNRMYGSQILLISQTWGKQLPYLLASANDQKFRQIYQNYLNLRDDMGYQEIALEFSRLLKSR